MLREAQAPVIHATSHVDHKEELHGFLSMYTWFLNCSMVLRLEDLGAAGAPLLTRDLLACILLVIVIGPSGVQFRE